MSARRKTPVVSDAASSVSSVSSAPSSVDVDRLNASLEKYHQGKSCMSWLVPVLVLIGTGLLVYMMYKYWCGGMSYNDDNNDSNGVLVISNMTNKDGSKTSEKPPGKSTGQVIDLQGNQLMSKQNETPVIVAIMAEGCGHCTQLKPKWHEAAKISSKQLYSLYAHSPGGMEVCKALQIKGFPTIICLHKGKIVSEFNLDRTPQNIAQWVNSL